MTDKKLIAGNWKMNGSLAQSVALASGVSAGLRANRGLAHWCDFLVCPPFVHISAVQAVLDPGIELGAQDCSANNDGAFTGDISALMLTDLNVNTVILGHSERRQYHGETDASIKSKAEKAHHEKLVALICVGETEAEREEGKAEDVVLKQLKGSIPEQANAENTIIAYEPVWAIGTGKTATAGDIAIMHAFIRKNLNPLIRVSDKVRILYGGSVKPANAAEIFAVDHVDGALIGGASLKADDFLGIAKAVCA